MLEQLKKKFPKLFSNCSNNLDISIGGGWRDLVEGLCLSIEELLDEDNDVVVLQIKEKFGGLRFYFEGSVEGITDLVRDASSKSFRICETCGKEGSLTAKGYRYRTICEACIRNENT
ncbi:MAG: hypothetical protein R3213_05550 [Flavobacteriaceae bacterium]|nr:hypothetical protein [Flavobacteriaceae bacterium]